MGQRLPPIEVVDPEDNESITSREAYERAINSAENERSLLINNAANVYNEKVRIAVEAYWESTGRLP
jgi:hypothetical protein